MIGVSFISSWGYKAYNKENIEVFRTASSYYLPEGRFYAAPTVLKKKKSLLPIFPLFIGACFSCFLVTPLHQTTADSFSNNHIQQISSQASTRFVDANTIITANVNNSLDIK